MRGIDCATDKGRPSRLVEVSSPDDDETSRRGGEDGWLQRVLCTEEYSNYI